MKKSDRFHSHLLFHRQPFSVLFIIFFIYFDHIRQKYYIIIKNIKRMAVDYGLKYNDNDLGRTLTNVTTETKIML